MLSNAVPSLRSTAACVSWWLRPSASCMEAWDDQSVPQALHEASLLNLVIAKARPTISSSGALAGISRLLWSAPWADTGMCRMGKRSALVCCLKDWEGFKQPHRSWAHAELEQSSVSEAGNCP